MTQTGPVPWENLLYPAFIAAGQRTGIDPALLFAIAMKESSLKPDRVTTYADPRTGEPVHHDGLMQLSVENEKAYGVTDPFEAGQNVMGGALLLRDNLKMYDGDLNKALQQYNGGNPSRWGAATRSYVQDVRNNYKGLAGQEAPDVLPQFIKPPPPPMLRPAALTTPAPPVHLNMNTDPSAGPNFAQYQQDPLTTAQMPSGDPAASLPSLQPAITPASRGPALPLQPTGQPPSPFVQAFLTNAIFGGGSPPYPFGIGTGTRPGGQGGR